MASEARGVRAGVGLWLALGVVVLVSVIGWVRLAGCGSWVTGAHVLVWKDPQGAVIAGGGRETLNCRQDGLSYVIAGAHVWTTCEGKDLAPPIGDGAIARIDVAQGEGRLWALPAGVDLFSTLAMLPGPNGSLAVVFTAHAPKPALLRVVAGIVGPSGWIQVPASLDSDAGDTNPLGGAWVGQAVELAVNRRVKGVIGDEHGERSAPAIVRLGLDGSKAERAIPADVLLADLDDTAAIQAAYRTTQGWHFLIRVGEYGQAGDVWDVREDGTRVSTGYRSRWDLGATVDRSAVGMSSGGHRAERLLQPDGRLVALPPAPAVSEGWELLRHDSTIDFIHGALVARPRWAAYEVDHRGKQDPESARVEIVAGRTVTAHCPDSGLLFVWIGPPTEHQDPVAHDTGCLYGARPTWVERPAGGYWLVAGNGTYLTVDADGQRIDPLNPIDHLLAEGGDNSTHTGRPPGWLLVALLVTLLSGLPGAVGVALVWRRRHVRAGAGLGARWRRLWLAGLLLYALAELFSLATLWKLMA